MSLTSDLIAERIATDVEPRDLALVRGLIEDALPPGAGLEQINSAIAKARTVYGTSLFLPQATATTPATPAAPPAHETVTARVLREAREQRQAPATFNAEPNPWAAGSINITRQVALEAKEPARAAKLKREAGR